MHKVLFLDNEDDLIQDLPLLLKSAKIDMVATASISDAFDLFARESFGAVLLDCVMPPTGDIDAEDVNYGRETGVEVARRMKKIKPEIPIIFLSVVRDPKIQEKMRQIGISEIINKPAEVDHIANVLLKVIGYART